MTINPFAGANENSNFISVSGEGDLLWGDDWAWGSAGDDTIYGGLDISTKGAGVGDNDRIYADGQAGGTGNDIVVGGAGADSIFGEDGNDTIWGDGKEDSIYGDHNDTIEGGGGSDLIYGEGGDDVIYGYGVASPGFLVDGGDEIYGGNGDDTLNGGDGDDIIHGDDGNDSIIAGTGDDVVLGEDGDDIIDVTSGNNTITGGNATSFVNGGIGGGEISNGDDIFIFSSTAGFTNNMFTFSNNDTVTGDQDAIVVGASNFVRVRMVQDQAIVVEVDTDTTPGGDMNTYIINSFIIDSQEDADAFAASFFKDIGLNNAIDAGNLDMDAYVSGSYGTEHIDLIFGTDTNDPVTFGHDLIESFGNNDTINSLGGNDTINSGGGEDFIDASAGNDLVYAEAGNDIVQGKAGKDTLWGQEGNDILNGGGDNDILIGGTGDDFLVGQGGHDNLYAGSGTDALFGGPGNDLLSAAAGYGQGGDGNDTLDGGAGNDTLVAGHGGNILRGGADADILYAGTGADILEGGTGADIFVFSNDAAKSDSTNTDTIRGWESGIDKIDVTGLGFMEIVEDDATLSTWIKTQLVYEYENGNTVITSNYGHRNTGHSSSDFKLVIEGEHNLGYAAKLAAGDPNWAENDFTGFAGGGTVICTELHRQGYMSDDIYEADTAFGANLSKTDPEVLLGYHFWAKPIVKLMQKSNIVTQLVRLPASCWANEMAYQIGAQEKGSMFGKTIMAVGIPACRVIGKLMNRRKTVQGNS